MPIKAILFDFMGTCLDWHQSITSSLPSAIAADTKSEFALQWRETYFQYNNERTAAGLPVQDIDITHAHTLEMMLSKPEYTSLLPYFTPNVRRSLVAAWHQQPAWPEVAGAIEKLRARGWEIFVHANGTTRLQLDLCRYAGLEFDMLFSSYLIGKAKPDRANYARVLELIQRQPEECVTVAAHAYDTRGAKAVGMKTVYIHRWTDDINEDQEAVKREHDAWLEDMTDLDSVIARL